MRIIARCALVLIVTMLHSSVFASDTARIAIEHAEAVQSNDTWLEEYTWRNTLEILKDGRRVAISHNAVKIENGETTMTALPGEDSAEEQVQSNFGTELTNRTRKLIQRYTRASVGTLVDFFDSASFTPEQVGDSRRVRISGTGFVMADDRVTFVLDYPTRRPFELTFESNVDGERVVGTFQYELQSDRPFLPKTAEIAFPEKSILARVQNFGMQWNDRADEAPSGVADGSTEAEDDDQSWPKSMVGLGHNLTLFQPQLETWKRYRTLEAKVAVVLRRIGSEESHIGALEITATTNTDFGERTVLVRDVRPTSIQFPALEGEEAVQAAAIVKQLLPRSAIPISLDRVLAAFEADTVERPATEVNLDPPKIVYSNEHAILVSLFGEPDLVTVEGTGLEQATNTTSDLFRETETGAYFLLYEDAWLRTSDLAGAWEAATELPDGLGRLPEQLSRVSAHVPGYQLTEAELPRVYVEKEPAELLVVYGKPEYVPIPDTQLFWVSNTESDLFLNVIDRNHYYLVAGRWFRTAELGGSWEPATTSLPEDFRRIPRDHVRARVRVSVPGTPEAQEALIIASIPQTAKVKRDGIEATVEYIGDPRWRAIDESSETVVYYAENTSEDVFRIGSRYYLCQNGIWFEAPTANGVWTLCDDVPTVLYSIPSSSPKHHVTYVQVYDTSPDYVVVGYTGGYLGTYVAAGVVVAGACWYYNYHSDYWHHWHHHYHYHHHYAGHHHYHHYHTGYGHGARYSYHYGGYHSAAGYHSSYGRFAATQQVRTPYGSYGRTTVQRGNDWARAGHRSGARGTVRAYEDSAGRKAITARGRNGSRGGIARDANNNTYVGRDGNLYKKSNGKWQKYDRRQGWSDIDSRRRSGDRTRPQAGGQRSRATNRTSRETRERLKRDSRTRRSGSDRVTRKSTQRRSSGSRYGSGSHRSNRGGYHRGGARTGRRGAYGGSRGGVRRGGGGRRGGGRRG